MKLKFGLIIAGAFVALTVITGSVLASQSSKNTWRNIGIGSAALAGVGLLNHNGTEALVGAAGAAYSANRYEQDRHHQAQRSAWYHRHHHYYHHHYYSH